MTNEVSRIKVISQHKNDDLRDDERPRRPPYVISAFQIRDWNKRLLETHKSNLWSG